MAYIRDINFFTPKKRPEVVDAEAVRQELAILFNTKPPQRLFEPEFGIDLESYLFDLISVESANAIFFEVTSKVKRYVPSVIIDMASSTVTPDYDNNRYVLILYFRIRGAEDNGSYEYTKPFNSNR